MTAAFNLAQLANNLNTSGQLDATDGLSGLVANANLASSGTASSSTYLRGDRTWAAISGRILQQVSLNNTTIYTSTASTPTEVSTALRLSITPTATSSKILVCYSLPVGGSFSGDNNFVYLYRNTTQLAYSTGFYTDYSNNQTAFTRVIMFIDTPSTTSAITYRIYSQVQSGYSQYINSRDGSVLSPSTTAYALEIGQ